ncbi:hypothetical protein AV530_016836 [Patagioenas fasciata monilis]|uniref:Uncharacterized protein n=1 Tax=Patagioenas fasciata monilis TaxID=372326 RepID=A0A1V4J4X4_PATFA|nr:hypothetical protein AV530_016836 [Patagioenas fasciata monilis]
MELFTPMDCEVGPQSLDTDVKIQVITSENAVWLSTMTSLNLHPLLVSDSRVLVFQVTSVNTCTFSRGDNVGTVLPMSRTQHCIEVQSEKAQARALQTV